MTNQSGVPFTHQGATLVNGFFYGQSLGNSINNNGPLTIGPGGQLATFNTCTVGSVTGAGLINIFNGTFTAGGDNTSTTFTGTMLGAGTFIKVGSGTITFATPAWFGGSATVEAP